MVYKVKNYRGGFLGIGVLVSDRGLDVRDSISTGAGMRLDTRVHRSWSWLIRLAKMLFVLCSKV